MQRGKSRYHAKYLHPSAATYNIKDEADVKICLRRFQSSSNRPDHVHGYDYVHAHAARVRADRHRN